MTEFFAVYSAVPCFCVYSNDAEYTYIYICMNVCVYVHMYVVWPTQ
jgi:hypothetical protein